MKDADPSPVAIRDIPTVAPVPVDMPTSPPDAFDPQTVPPDLAVLKATIAAVIAAEKVPGFELFEEVGRGGMGIVYRARDEELDREVAVKVLKKTLADEHHSYAVRFVAEARITARLQHPGIPPVYRVGQLPDGRPFLAMKLIRGETLSKLLQERGHGKQWLAVFESICQAVGAAHAAGYIHRDLKPQNVMVGAFGEVQVMDWGLAKRLTDGDRKRAGTPPVRAASVATVSDAVSHAPKDSTTVQPNQDASTTDTQAGAVMGTYSYMPPEQAWGDIDRIDRRADVFALGAILCELLTGAPPLSGQFAVLESVKYGMFEDAYQRLDECREERELIDLAKRCLSVAPSGRPADASRVATTVEMFRNKAAEWERLGDIAVARSTVHMTEQHKQARQFRWMRRAFFVCATVISVLVWWGIEAKSRAKAVDASAMEELEVMRDGLIQTKWDLKNAHEQTKRDLEAKAAAELNKSENAHQKTKVDLSNSYDKLGTATLRLGQAKEAKVFYQLALEIDRKLVAADPEDTGLHRNLGISYDRLGDVTRQLGQTEDALDFYQKGLDEWRKVADADPKNAGLQRALSVSYDNVGDVVLLLGQSKDALSYYQKGLVVREELAAADSDNIDAQLALSTSYNKIGDATLRLSGPKDALTYYLKALDVNEKVTTADPKNAVAQAGLFVSCRNLGLLAKNQHSYSAAISWFETAHTTLLSLQKKKMLSGEYQNSVGDLERLIATCKAELAKQTPRELAPKPRPAK